MSSLAYQLVEEPAYLPEAGKPQVRPRALKNKSVAAPVQHREAESVSVFAIVGFLIACALVVLVLLSHIELDQVNSQTAALSTQLSSLQEEYEDLSAQYEQMFDLEGIKTNLMNSGLMIQISSQQQIYMDLSQPDSSTTIEEEFSSPIHALWASLSDLFE